MFKYGSATHVPFCAFMKSTLPTYCCEGVPLKLNWPFGSSIEPNLGSAVMVVGLVSVNGPTGPTLMSLVLPYIPLAFITSQPPMSVQDGFDTGFTEV